MQKRDKIYIALLVFMVAAGIGTREYQSHKIDVFNPDGGYVDTLLQDHRQLVPITSDMATPETQRDYDSSVKAQEAEDSAYKPKDTGLKFKPDRVD